MDYLLIATLGWVNFPRKSWVSFNYKSTAIEYDFSNGDICTCTYCPNQNCEYKKHSQLHPVLYSNKRFDASIFAAWWITNDYLLKSGLPNSYKLGDMLNGTKLSLFKDLTWKYENEWRILLNNNSICSRTGIRTPIKKKPKSIYLGVNISSESRHKLLQLASMKHIPAYEMYIDYYSADYNLQSREITTT